MKKSGIYLILVMLAFASCKPKTSGEAEIVKSITIKYTELGRETLFKISCQNFDKYFPQPHVKNLSKKATIDSVMNTLNGMKSADNDIQPDIRSKIFITHPNNAVDTLCVGVTILNYKGRAYETPPELLRLIQQ